MLYVPYVTNVEVKQSMVLFLMIIAFNRAIQIMLSYMLLNVVCKCIVINPSINVFGIRVT